MLLLSLVAGLFAAGLVDATAPRYEKTFENRVREAVEKAVESCF